MRQLSRPVPCSAASLSPARWSTRLSATAARARALLPLLIGFLFPFLPFCQGQELDSTFFAGYTPRSIGPAGMSGRVAAIVADPDNPSLIYVGSATGGIWKTTNKGVTWTPIFDNQPVSGIGALALDPNNPNVLWVGTGEANTRNSAGVGRGVYRTLDGGRTWQYLGLAETERISRIHVHPHNPDVVYVAALGTAWGENPERGVFRTTDGGRTWERILYVDEKTGAADLAIDPNNPNRMICSMWQFRRWPWFFQSGGPSSGVYRTSDGGDTWTKLTPRDGLPKGELGRGAVAYAPSKPEVVYLLLEAEESVMLRSTNGGYDWQTVQKGPNVNPRPFYFCDIRVHPTDYRRVYRLQTTLDISHNSGRSFSPLFSYTTIHPDHHALWIHPNGRMLINGNDGGVAISEDEGHTWRFVRNLPLAQFYHMSVDMDFPYNIYGGMQDNGSWRGPSNTFKNDGIYNESWEMVSFGDGFATLPDPERPEYGYAMWQGGNLVYFHYPTGIRKMIRPTEQDTPAFRYNWNAAIAIDPFDAKTVYYGSQYVNKSSNRGNSWTVISPDLTTNDPEKQKQDESGGLTRDVTAAENHTTILTIAPSPVKQGVLWAGTDDGNVQVTRDGGQNWTNVTDNLLRADRDLPPGTWVPHVEASRFEAGTAFVVLDDHRRANWMPYVFVTRNYGQSWKSLVTDDIDGFPHVIRQDLEEPNLLFLGTEFGLFVSFDGGQAWQKWKTGFPTVPVRDLRIHPREHDLVIATHGRGIYILDDIRPLRTVARHHQDSLHLFDIGTAWQYHTEYFSSFANFVGEGEFRGEQRAYGALIHYVVNPPDSVQALADTDEEPELDIEILDADSNVIRTLKGPLKRGLHRVNWTLHRREYKTPSRSADSGDEEDEQPGIQVPPGTYTVRMKYGGQTQTRTVEVRMDPRIDYDQAGYGRNLELQQKVGQMLETLHECTERIHTTKTRLGQIGILMKDIDTTRKNLVALRDTIPGLKKELSAMMDTLLPKPNVQGLIRNDDLLAIRISKVAQGLMSYYGAPTEALLTDHQQNIRRLEAFLESYNAFFREKITAFLKDFEAANLPILEPFQEVEWKE